MPTTTRCRPASWMQNVRSIETSSPRMSSGWSLRFATGCDRRPTGRPATDPDGGTVSVVHTLDREAPHVRTIRPPGKLRGALGIATAQRSQRQRTDCRPDLDARPGAGDLARHTPELAPAESIADPGHLTVSLDATAAALRDELRSTFEPLALTELRLPTPATTSTSGGRTRGFLSTGVHSGRM